jgi:LmbE family N-acetylglucosaminyl deacetylase
MRVLALSPHLDDAAFSAGATLATLIACGHRVTLVTAFTASVPHPSSFALAQQVDRGIPAGVDYMALRRDEDIAAAARLGVHELVHLPFPDAPDRGYGSPEALFGPLRDDDDVAADLHAALAVLGRFDLVLAPLGLNDHVDHRQLLRALGLPTRVDDPEPLERLPLGPLALWRDIPHVLHGDDPPTPGADAVVVSGAALRRKLSACACYATQLDEQFGGEAAMREALSSLAFAEGGRHGRPAAAEAFAPAGPLVRALRAPLAIGAARRR